MLHSNRLAPPTVKIGNISLLLKYVPTLVFREPLGEGECEGSSSYGARFAVGGACTWNSGNEKDGELNMYIISVSDAHTKDPRA